MICAFGPRFGPHPVLQFPLFLLPGVVGGQFWEPRPTMVLKPQKLSTNCNIRGNLQLRRDPNKVSNAWVEVSSIACCSMVPIMAGRGSKAAKSGTCILGGFEEFKSHLLSQTYDCIYFHHLTMYPGGPMKAWTEVRAIR